MLVIFLKAPHPGRVKTRLAEAIGGESACAAYRQLVEHLLARLADLRDVELRFSPDDALKEITPWLKPGWRARPQGDGDLGMRLERAFAEHFASGADRVIVIGSDCPWITVEDIAAAEAALPRHDVVLGPANDGGYWLIGLSRPQPQLFQDMPWSTSDVCAETLQRAQASVLQIHQLRELEDIDTITEWKKFCRHLSDGRIS